MQQEPETWHSLEGEAVMKELEAALTGWLHAILVGALVLPIISLEKWVRRRLTPSSKTSTCKGWNIKAK